MNTYMKDRKDMMELEKRRLFTYYKAEHEKDRLMLTNPTKLKLSLVYLKLEEAAFLLSLCHYNNQEYSHRFKKATAALKFYREMPAYSNPHQDMTPKMFEEIIDKLIETEKKIKKLL